MPHLSGKETWGRTLYCCVHSWWGEQIPLSGCFQLSLALGGGLAGGLASEMLSLCCALAWLQAHSWNLNARGIICLVSSIFQSSLPPGTHVASAAQRSHTCQSACSFPPYSWAALPEAESVRSFGNLRSNEIHKKLWTLCHPQELEPWTCTGNCILHVFLANLKCPFVFRHTHGKSVHPHSHLYVQTQAR